MDLLSGTQVPPPQRSITSTPTTTTRLALPTPSVTQSSSNSKQIPEKPSSEDNLLDELLKLESNPSDPANKEQHPSGNTRPEEKKGEDLESWLDSVI